MIITNSTQRMTAIIMLLLPFLLTACGADESGASKRAKRDHLVEVQQAEIMAVRTRLVASGSLRAEKNVRIYNEISARITELPFYPGDTVNEGEIIAKLDDSIIRAELEKAEAQQRQAESDYQRVKKLKPKQLASDEEIARARTELDIASAEVRLQRTRLQLSTLRAPFTGIITERHVEPGDVVSLHSHISTLIDPDSLHLRTSLAERWIPYIAVGDHVSIRIDTLGPMQHDASIHRIYPGIDESTRKGTIEIGFEPQPFGVRAGQLANAEFHTQSVDRLVIPAQSLHHDSQGAYVYTLNDENKANKTYVTKGQQYGEQLAIDGGLSVGDRVVTRGFIGLRNGKSVTVTSEDSTS